MSMTTASNVNASPRATTKANMRERYRPASFADILGNGDHVASLAEFADAPYSHALILAGTSGVGKTTAAMALATALGCDDVAKLWKIDAGTQTPEMLDLMRRDLRYAPMGGGWRVVMVEEADGMARGKIVEEMWLTILDNLPPRTVFVFTTNHLAKLSGRFRKRCEAMTFESDARTMMADAQIYVNRIWEGEGLPSDTAPDARTLDIIDESGNLSFAAVTSELEGPIRLARRKLADQPAMEASPAPAPFVLSAPREAPASLLPSPFEQRQEARDCEARAAAQHEEKPASPAPTPSPLTFDIPNVAVRFNDATGQLDATVEPAHTTIVAESHDEMVERVARATIAAYVADPVGTVKEIEAYSQESSPVEISPRTGKPKRKYTKRSYPDTASPAPVASPAPEANVAPEASPEPISPAPTPRLREMTDRETASVRAATQELRREILEYKRSLRAFGRSDCDWAIRPKIRTHANRLKGYVKAGREHGINVIEPARAMIGEWGMVYGKGKVPYRMMHPRIAARVASILATCRAGKPQPQPPTDPAPTDPAPSDPTPTPAPVVSPLPSAIIDARPASLITSNATAAPIPSDYLRGFTQAVSGTVDAWGLIQDGGYINGWLAGIARDADAAQHEEKHDAAQHEAESTDATDASDPAESFATDLIEAIGPEPLASPPVTLLPINPRREQSEPVKPAPVVSPPLTGFSDDATPPLTGFSECSPAPSVEPAPVKPETVKPAKPASPAPIDRNRLHASLTLTIDKGRQGPKDYAVTVDRASRTILLESKDGTVYTIGRDENGRTCTCPDWVERGRNSVTGCKHLQAARAVGLLKPVVILETVNA